MFLHASKAATSRCSFTRPAPPRTQPPARTRARAATATRPPPLARHDDTQLIQCRTRAHRAQPRPASRASRAAQLAALSFTPAAPGVASQPQPGSPPITAARGRRAGRRHHRIAALPVDLGRALEVLLLRSGARSSLAARPRPTRMGASDRRGEGVSCHRADERHPVTRSDNEWLPSWSRMTAGPPTGRRTTDSSSTAQISGGSGQVNSSWRAIRAARRRSVASGSGRTWPPLMTARA